MELIPVGYLERAYQLAMRLQKWNRNHRLLILGHRDGDGISAATVILQSLQAIGFKRIATKILLSPDLEKLQEILAERPYEYVVTGDIGAGFESILKEEVMDFIIADHHPNENKVYGHHQLNPCEFGMNDEIDCSGSTTAAMIFINHFSEEFWKSNGQIILCYAIAGAISDFQLVNEPVSVNKYVLEFAANSGAISIQKDISFFGRGMYPIATALNRSGIPGFEDMSTCNLLLHDLFPLKEDEQWRRIIDLSVEEKQQLTTAIYVHLSTLPDLDINPSNILKDVIGNVYDLIGLAGWDCTRLPDGRSTLDAREILHRVNYVCRRGKADLALKLLNHQFVETGIWTDIETYHRTGDREVAQALEMYESGKIPTESWDDRVVMADFTGIIYYDEVGVVAGVIMKKCPQIEIMLSCCEIEDNVMKLSTRAREDVWHLLEKQTNELADAKKVYKALRKKYPLKVMQYGGHRFACSGYISRDIIPEFFQEMLNYYLSLHDPKKADVVEEPLSKTEIHEKTSQRRLEQFFK